MRQSSVAWNRQVKEATQSTNNTRDKHSSLLFFCKVRMVTRQWDHLLRKNEYIVLRSQYRIIYTVWVHLHSADALFGGVYTALPTTVEVSRLSWVHVHSAIALLVVQRTAAATKKTCSYREKRLMVIHPRVLLLMMMVVLVVEAWVWKKLLKTAIAWFKLLTYLDNGNAWLHLLDNPFPGQDF